MKDKIKKKIKGMDTYPFIILITIVSYVVYTGIALGINALADGLEWEILLGVLFTSKLIVLTVLIVLNVNHKASED